MISIKSNHQLLEQQEDLLRQCQASYYDKVETWLSDFGTGSIASDIFDKNMSTNIDNINL